MKMLGRTFIAGAAMLALGACSEASDNTIKKGEDGMPAGDTGWSMNKEGEALVMQRQINQLSLTYKLEMTSTGPQSQVTAHAKPCINGKGEQSSNATFEPLGADDASELSQIREQFEEVVTSVNDLCIIPPETVAEIPSGFDGLYFRSASERAAITGL